MHIPAYAHALLLSLLLFFWIMMEFIMFIKPGKLGGLWMKVQVPRVIKKRSKGKQTRVTLKHCLFRSSASFLEYNLSKDILLDLLFHNYIHENPYSFLTWAPRFLTAIIYPSLLCLLICSYHIPSRFNENTASLIYLLVYLVFSTLLPIEFHWTPSHFHNQ